MDVCPYCGARVDGERPFCTACGKNLFEGPDTLGPDAQDRAAYRPATTSLPSQHTVVIADDDEDFGMPGPVGAASPTMPQGTVQVLDQTWERPAIALDAPAYASVGNDAVGMRSPVAQPVARKRQQDVGLKVLVGVLAAVAIGLFGVVLFRPGGLLNQGSVEEQEEKQEPASEQSEEDESFVSIIESDDEAEDAADTDESKKKDDKKTEKDEGSTVPKDYQPDFTTAEASSTAPADEYSRSGGYTYGPENVLSDNIDVAWNGHRDDCNFKGEFVLIRANSEQWVTGVGILNGYAKNDGVFYRNCRPSQVTITLSDGFSKTVNLSTEFSTTPQPINFGGKHQTSYIKVTIEDWAVGSAYAFDCCIDRVIPLWEP